MKNTENKITDKKVYCENCKYFASKSKVNCDKILRIEKVPYDDVYSKGSVTLGHRAVPENDNRKNKCPYYVKKFWLFWIE